MNKDFIPSKIAWGVVTLLGSLLLIVLGERFTNETKVKYESQFYLGAWSEVVKLSVIFGFLSGLMAGLGGYLVTNGNYYLFLINFGVMVGYIGGQSIMTDLTIREVNRMVLRVAYLDMMVSTVLLQLSQYNSLGVAIQNSSTVIALYVALGFIFLFSSIGPSDVRAIAISLPFLTAIDTRLGILTFLGIVTIAISYMTEIKKINENPMIAVPILPALTLPYIAITPLIPVLVQVLQVQKLF